MYREFLRCMYLPMAKIEGGLLRFDFLWKGTLLLGRSADWPTSIEPHFFRRLRDRRLVKLIIGEPTLVDAFRKHCSRLDALGSTLERIFCRWIQIDICQLIRTCLIILKR